MVENAVKDNFHTFFVRGVQKAFEVVFRPQKFVHFQIIAGVVAVIRKRLENRRKINYADAKFFKVIEFFANAVEVSAKKVVGVIFPVCAHDLGTFRKTFVQAVFPFCFYAVRAIEPVDENMINNIAFCKIGGFIRRFIYGQLPFRKILAAYAFPVFTATVIPYAVAVSHFKAIIINPRRVENVVGGINRKTVFGFFKAHFDGRRYVAEPYEHVHFIDAYPRRNRKMQGKFFPAFYRAVWRFTFDFP